jgi:two-component system, LuxR family, response regulator FixJ
MFIDIHDLDQGRVFTRASDFVDATGRAPMIFIVDDDSATRDSLRLLLGCVGLEARDFPSVKAFLEARQSADEACLVLDVHLPGMSGLDLLEELRRRGDAIPVIVVTGRPSVASTARAQAAGAFAILEKPFKAAEIIELVRNALERKNGSTAKHPNQ